MKKNIIAFAPVIILSILTGCEKLSFDAFSSRTIGVNVSVQDELQTKGKEVLTENLGSEYGVFVMDCWVDSDYTVYAGADSTKVTDRHYFSKADVNYNSSTGWNFSSAKQWLNGVNMTFWSWAPKNSAIVIDNTDLSGKDSLSFTYTSPSTVKAQKDILFGYTFSAAAKHSDETTNNTLDVQFYHALAQIRFAVSPDDNTFKTTGYEIVSISLSGIPSYGKCIFDGPVSKFYWSGQNTPASFTSSCGNYTTSDEWKEGSYSSYKLYTTKDVFFVVPNTATGRYVDVTFKRLTDNKLISKQVAVTDEWKAGKYYTYKIEATDIKSDLSLTLSTDPWDSVDEDVLYHTVVATTGGQLTFEEGKYIPAADPTTREVTIKNGQPVPVSLSLESPIDGEIIISLSGYIGAFKVDNLDNNIIESPAKTTTFEIVPLIDDPKMDYKVQVHVYVKFKDGKVVNADDVVQAGGIPHTVILPAI